MGLDVVDDEEVEVEVHRIEEDEEVAWIYEDAKDKHRKIMTGGLQGLSLFACVGSGDPVRVLRLYTMNTLDIL